jgi:hypothetical protein
MRILKLIGAILIVIATPAFAKDGKGSWILTQKSGDVRVLRSGMQPASLQVRAALSPGDLVATGANGRAMLTRGDDYVVVAPGSRLLLPKGEQAKGLTRLIQQVGTMLYKVKHTGVPHFAVDTPMLAAVVKGTTFTVIVDENRAAVQVTDGVVEVSASAGTARRLVQRGMTVYVGRERPDAIIEMKAGARDLPVSSSGGDDAVKIAGSGDVPVSVITNLTGGLVREAPPVAVAAAPVAAAPKPVVEIVKATAPVAGDVPADVAETTAPSIGQPVLEPVTAVTAPVANTVVAPVTNVTAPVTNTVVAPVTNVTAPVVNTVVAPIVETVTNVTAPVVNTVVAPIVETVTNVTAPVVNTVVAPIVETVTTVVAPIVQPVTTVVAPIVQPVTAVVAPIVQPVTTVVAPVIAPVTTVTAPVIAPVTTILQPVTTLLPGLGGLKL